MTRWPSSQRGPPRRSLTEAPPTQRFIRVVFGLKTNLMSFKVLLPPTGEKAKTEEPDSFGGLSQTLKGGPFTNQGNQCRNYPSETGKKGVFNFPL